VREDHNLYWSRADEEITAEFVSGHDSAFARAEIADGTWAASTGQGQGSITSEPLFVSGWPEPALSAVEGVVEGALPSSGRRGRDESTPT